MRLGNLVLSLAILTPLAATAAPKAVVPPLRAGADISEAVRAGFEKKLRESLAAHVEVVGAEPTRAALAEAGAEKGCEDAACARKVAGASGARFVVIGHVLNEAEIYKVTVAVFDAAHDKIVRTEKKSCELCAVAEVNGTIDAVVAALGEILKAPPPEKPEKAPADGRVALVVRSEPPGARVAIDGEPAGTTPVTVRVETGGHTVTLAKEGYLDEERAVTVGEKGLELDVPLRVVAEPAAALATATVEPPARTGSYLPWGWGLTLGGAAAAGAGTFLILLDGEITCEDRGREACPTVYNTKGGGIAALGIGAAALGVGITLLVLDPGDVPVGGEATLQPTAGGGALLNWSSALTF